MPRFFPLSRRSAPVLVDSVGEHISPQLRAGLAAWAGATGAVAAAVGIAFGLVQLVPLANLSLVFLLGVLVVASRWGLTLSLYAAVLSFLAFNFFFTEPHFTLAVQSDTDVATLVLFLAAAALAGRLAARMRDQTRKNQAGIRRIDDLYAFAKRMTSAVGTDEVLRQLVQRLSQLLQAPVVVLLPDAGDALVVRAGHPSAHAVEVQPRFLETTWRDHSPAASPSGVSFLTLGTSSGPIGLVAVKLDPLPSEHWEQARALCDQAAIALERTRLVADLDASRLTTETEQLRSALLASVSHELQGPLSTIIDTTAAMLQSREPADDSEQGQRLGIVRDEAERLDRYLQSLLAMTRLGEGGLSLRRDWMSIDDLVSAVRERMGPALTRVKLEVDLPDDSPKLYVHGPYIEQALVNLLDNAVRFSPSEGTVRLRGRIEGGRLILDVIDRGPGIPEAERERVFESFNAKGGGTRLPARTGLGLAVCRSLVGAHGGEVVAMAGDDGVGTCMRMSLPLPDEQP